MTDTHNPETDTLFEQLDFYGIEFEKATEPGDYFTPEVLNLSDLMRTLDGRLEEYQPEEY